MASSEPEAIERLLRQAAFGDTDAINDLLQPHRSRLKQMVCHRMNPRLNGRFDPSDVVQDALMMAHAGIAQYAKARPLPFYVWLRRLTWQKLVEYERKHLKAKRRSVLREEIQPVALSNDSADHLTSRLVSLVPAPDQASLQNELRQRVQLALAQLDETYREVLLLRYLEDLSMKEIGAVLEISEPAAKMRHLRAVRQFRDRFVH